MRFHVIGLPHTDVTDEYSACAFTMKAKNFCRMMHERGHEVFLYAGPRSDAPVAEFFPCVTEKARRAHVGDKHYTEASWDADSPLWQKFITKTVSALGRRIQPQDFICLIGGYSQKAISDAFPKHLSVEIGVGYGGCFLPYKVFESYAWMHTIYGARSMNNPCAVDGTWFDAVIPGYLDPAQYPVTHQSDYYLYVGRLIDRKGYKIAQDVCEKLGKRLILAGPGEQKGYGEFVGVVNPEERGVLMAGATALFAPTIYVEPFGNVAVEAMACGTPVISTDWGAFTETVQEGVTGYRCRMFAEFVRAAQIAPLLDRAAIREYAIKRYSLDPVGQMYEDYFQRLSTLWGAGWYAE